MALYDILHQSGCFHLGHRWLRSGHIHIEAPISPVLKMCRIPSSLLELEYIVLTGVPTRCRLAFHSMRHQIDHLLLALWADPMCKASAMSDMSSAANVADGGIKEGHLVDYARAVLNNLMYLLKVRFQRPMCFASCAVNRERWL